MGISNWQNRNLAELKNTLKRESEKSYMNIKFELELRGYENTNEIVYSGEIPKWAKWLKAETDMYSLSYSLLREIEKNQYSKIKTLDELDKQIKGTMEKFEENNTDPLYNNAAIKTLKEIITEIGNTRKHYKTGIGKIFTP